MSLNRTKCTFPFFETTAPRNPEEFDNPHAKYSSKIKIIQKVWRYLWNHYHNFNHIKTPQSVEKTPDSGKTDVFYI